MGARFARSLPDFLVIGAPKAGSTALHDALATHPSLYPSPVKEPKYFLSPDRRPARRDHRGPGDAHSAREWVWRRRDYERLFADAPTGLLRFESTPFYLWDKASHPRIAETLGRGVKLIAVIRDPVDRAFSNWSHLRADGLEPEADFLTACRAEPRRAASGWAPIWRYLELGRYGEQLEHLYRFVEPERVRVVRYRELVDEPVDTVDRLCEFLGVETGLVGEPPRSNMGRWASDNRTNDALRRVIVTGAGVGSYFPPQAWRRVEKPLLRVLQRGDEPRPKPARAARKELVNYFADDNALLSSLLGRDYSDWLAAEGNGTFTARRSWEPSAAEASMYTRMPPPTETTEA